MSEDWALKPHIKIPLENVKKRPKITGWGTSEEKEEIDNEYHGNKLLTQLEDSINYCNRKNKLIDEDYVLIVSTENNISTEDHTLNRLGFIFSLQMSVNTAAVVLDKNQLNIIKDELITYSQTSSLKTYFEKIITIKKPIFKRINMQLNDWFQDNEEEKNIEIEFLPNLGNEKYTKIQSEISRYLTEEKIELYNSRIRENSYSIKIRCSPQSVQTIIKGTDSIWQVRESSEIITSEPQRFDMKSSVIPDEPEENAKSICVLDTGIDYEHYLLQNAIIDHIDLTPDQNSKDVKGHGTFVAGIAAYGDLENTQIFSPSAKIISVKVQEVIGTPPPYLETYIEEAVQRYHNSAKIFNLSVMYPTKSDSANPSELAYTIDTLSKKYDVLFVVSSGNLKEEIFDFDLKQYPLYFSNEKCVVYCGAESSNCISVGGVAEKETVFSLAKKNHPSPFTRRGLFNNRAKPDVVHFAGNLECNSDGDHYENPLLNVISLGLSPNNFASDLGTSFSTPRISNMLAKLQQLYPNASANLLKALIIHFSEWPSEEYTLNASSGLKKTLYGKGIPDYDRCAFSTKYSASYILEDEIQFNEEANIPIYVPSNMKNIYGQKIMKVSLVYDPPVNRGALDYNLVDLDFKLYKPVKNQYKIQYKWDKFYRNTWDNVKSDKFRWARGGWGDEWFIRIIPRTRLNTKLQNMGLSSQKYALIVTLEDPSKNIDVYNGIQNRQLFVPQTMERYLTNVAVSSYYPIPS